MKCIVCTRARGRIKPRVELFREVERLPRKGGFRVEWALCLGSFAPKLLTDSAT